MLDNIIRAFSADHAIKVTGLTLSQLRYWDKTKFFEPAYASIIGVDAPIRLYSLKDLVGLKVLNVLRTNQRVSLNKLRKAAKVLSEYSAAPWAELKILVSKGDVTFIEPNTGLARTTDGQYVMLSMIDIITEVDRSIAALNVRGNEKIGHSSKTKNIVHNAPVFAGTRVPVRAVKRFLDNGHSVDEILSEYPSLERADILAVMENTATLVA